MVRLLAISLFILFSAVGDTMAQVPVRQAPPRPARPAHVAKPAPASAPAPAVRAIGALAGDVDSAGLRIASDLARVLDDGDKLRIFPMAGKGSLQDINDLLTLDMIDLAIVRSDVLGRIAKINTPQGFQARVNYLAKLYSEEVYILSRTQFTCLQDLTARKVSFGPKDAGMAITAETIFEANAIAVNPVYLDHDEAIERLKRGELDALVYVGAKPSRAFAKITHKDNVHFLDVEYLPALQAHYLPAVLTAEDYPDLVAPNESVGTLAVSTVMVVRALPPQSERFRLLARFTEKFFASLDTFKAGSFSAKWREVDIRAPLRGWRRFPPAEAWLTAHAAPPAPEPVAAPAPPPRSRTMRQKSVKTQRGNAETQEELFNRFVRWYQQQNRPQR